MATRAADGGKRARGGAASCGHGDMLLQGTRRRPELCLVRLGERKQGLEEAAAGNKKGGERRRGAGEAATRVDEAEPGRDEEGGGRGRVLGKIGGGGRRSWPCAWSSETS